MLPREQIVGPLHGYYLACYTVEGHDGLYGYAKICAGPPQEVWDARYAIRKVGAGPFMSHLEAIEGVIAHATAVVAKPDRKILRALMRSLWF